MYIQTHMEKELNDTATYFKNIVQTYKSDLHKFSIEIEEVIDNIIKYYCDLCARDIQNMNTDDFIKNIFAADLKHYSDTKLGYNAIVFGIKYPVFNSYRTILKDFCKLLETNYIEYSTSPNKFDIIIKALQKRLKCDNLSYRILNEEKERKIQLIRPMLKSEVDEYLSENAYMVYDENAIYKIDNGYYWIITNNTILTALKCFAKLENNDKISEFINNVFGDSYIHMKQFTEIDNQLFLTINCGIKL